MKTSHKSSKFLDLEGVKFGTLTAVKMIGIDHYNQRQWECVCDCGKRLVIIAARLRKGNSKCYKCARESALTPTQTTNCSDQYLAGLFDGEGCVTLESRGAIQRISISVDCVFKPVLLEFRNRFGGTLTPCSRSPSQMSMKNPRLTWAWSLRTQANALRFMKSIVPFSMEKKSQLELAIDWLEKRQFYGRVTPDEFDGYGATVASEISRLKKFEFLQ